MRTILMLALAGFLLTPAAFADRKWNDNRRDNRYRYDDRRFDRDYYRNLPPGLQRKLRRQRDRDRRDFRRWDRDNWRDQRDRRYQYDWRNRRFDRW